MTKLENLEKQLHLIDKWISYTKYDTTCVEILRWCLSSVQPL